jgi:hypothetical protein
LASAVWLALSGLATSRRKIGVFGIVADVAGKARPAGGWPAGLEEPH